MRESRGSTVRSTDSGYYDISDDEAARSKAASQPVSREVSFKLSDHRKIKAIERRIRSRCADLIAIENDPTLPDQASSPKSGKPGGDNSKTLVDSSDKAVLETALTSACDGNVDDAKHDKARASRERAKSHDATSRELPGGKAGLPTRRNSAVLYYMDPPQASNAPLRRKANFYRHTIHTSSVPEGSPHEESYVAGMEHGHKSRPEVESVRRVFVQDGKSIAIRYNRPHVNHEPKLPMRQSMKKNEPPEAIGETAELRRPIPQSSNYDDEIVTTHNSPLYVDNIFDVALSKIKESLAHDLIHSLAKDPADAPGEPNSGHKRRRMPSSVPSQASGKYTQRKRTREGGRDPGDEDGSGDDDDEGDEERRPSRGDGHRPRGAPTPRFKCPFFQRRPEKYTKASCRGEGFADIGKLKDHLKRVHTQPLRCPRCWGDMVSFEAFIKHQQAEVDCVKRPEPADDRIRPDELRQIDFKKAPYANSSPEDKWKRLYAVLFPNDKSIPSPYEYQGISPRLEKVLYQALDEELTEELAALEPILSRIKQRIPTIIDKCKTRLMDLTPEDELTYPSSTSLSLSRSIDADTASQSTRTEGTRSTGSRASSHTIPSDIQVAAKQQQPHRQDGNTPLCPPSRCSDMPHGLQTYLMQPQDNPYYPTPLHIQQHPSLNLAQNVYPPPVFPPPTCNSSPPQPTRHTDHTNYTNHRHPGRLHRSRNHPDYTYPQNYPKGTPNNPSLISTDEDIAFAVSHSDFKDAPRREMEDPDPGVCYGVGALGGGNDALLYGGENEDVDVEGAFGFEEWW